VDDQASTEESRLGEAQGAFERGDFADALGAASDVLSEDPDSEVALLIKAGTLSV
jgi:Tfp pilus assembly protein PilF